MSRIRSLDLSLGRGRDDHHDQYRDHDPDIAEYHPGHRQAVALLAGLAYLIARHVTADDRDDRAEEREEDLAESEGERDAGKRVGRCPDRDRVRRRLVGYRLAQVPGQLGKLVIGLG